MSEDIISALFQDKENKTWHIQTGSFQWVDHGTVVVGGKNEEKSYDWV